MSTGSGMEEERSSAISLQGLAPALCWLYEHGVDSRTLARVLHVETGHLRVVRHRSGRLQFFAPGESLNALLSRPAAPLRKKLGVRADDDTVPRWPKRERHIEDLESRADSICAAHARLGQFAEGLSAVRALAPQGGYPSSALWFRFKARLHQHAAWFRLHLGMTTSAFEHARLALDLSHLAFKERRQGLDLRRISESCLIAAQAAVLASDPQTALKLLDLAAEASARISDPLGSEHFRLRGTACLQLASDAELERLPSYFEKAAAAMLEKQECLNDGQLMLASERHLALLGNPNVDMAARVVEQVEKDFPPQSLERAMAVNWAAACALSTGSPETAAYANKLLEGGNVQSGPFGHQATCSFLLSITPRIGLNPEFRRAWIRRALYENSSRNL